MRKYGMAQASRNWGCYWIFWDRRVSDKKGKNKHVKRKNCMAKREKKIILSGVTREAMEEAFGRYATADAEMQSINAAMDKEFVAIRERNAERLAELEQQKTESFEVMQVFATEQREVLFSAAEPGDDASALSGSARERRNSKPAGASHGPPRWNLSVSSCRRISAPRKRSPKTSCWPTERTNNCSR